MGIRLQELILRELEKEIAHKIENQLSLLFTGKEKTTQQQKYAELFVIELKTTGWQSRISIEDEGHILTNVFRLSKEQRNKLHCFKVKFYRALERFSILKIDDKYIISQRHLLDIENAFQEIYNEFIQLRKKIYDELQNTLKDTLKNILKKHSKLEYKHKLSAGQFAKITKLTNISEDFIDMNYTILPLSALIRHLMRLSSMYFDLAKEKKEYKNIAMRLYKNVEKYMLALKEAYENKTKELEQIISKLNGSTIQQTSQQKIQELINEIEDLAAFLGAPLPESIEKALNIIETKSNSKRVK